MLVIRYVVTMLSVTMLILSAHVVSGQNYPDRPIRIVSGVAGGGNDFTARLIAQGLTGPLGQQVIVDNRPTALYGEIVAKATPDGYTLLCSGSGLWIGQLLQDNVPYDAVRDFSAITLVDTAPSLLVVPPSLAINSVKELIALAKAKPGELNYGSGPAGSSLHLGGELFKSMAGVNIVRIAYKGGTPAAVALMNSEVQLVFASVVSAAPHIKSGRLRALAITSALPSTLAPGLPTVAASGLPGYELVSPDVILVPAKTPAIIIKRLNQEIVRVLNRTDVKEKFFTAGGETVGSSPDELTAFIKSDMAMWRKVIRDAGIKGD